MAGPKAAPSTTTIARPGLTPGQAVQWYDNGWRFGHLVSMGRKWAVVKYVGRNKRIKSEEVRAYHETQTQRTH